MSLISSDIDGTLVHPSQGCGNHSLLYVEPGQSERPAYISEKCIELIQSIRSNGDAVALLTGARASTALSRLLQLPACDALCFEEGGRILIHKQHCNDAGSPSVALPYTEDNCWRAQLDSQCGPAKEAHVAASRRSGSMWSLVNDPSLLPPGACCDTTGYTTCLRIKLQTAGGPGAKRNQDLQAKLASLGLQCTHNDNKLDVIPLRSGKANACKHLLQMLGLQAMVASLGDDDNDIGMLTQAQTRIFVRRNSESVRRLLQQQQQFAHIYDSGIECAHCSTEYALGDLLNQRMARD